MSLAELSGRKQEDGKALTHIGKNGDSRESICCVGNGQTTAFWKEDFEVNIVWIFIGNLSTHLAKRIYQRMSVENSIDYR